MGLMSGNIEDPTTRPAPHRFGRYDITRSARACPTYIIQACGVQERNSQIQLLLGPHLETTSLSLGKKNPHKKNARRLRIKTDAPQGVQIGDIPYNTQDPHDVFGHVGGDRNFVETVHARAGTFSCDIGVVESGKTKIIRFENSQPTLLIDRRPLIHDAIAPELRDAKTDPYFGEVILLSFTFGELVDKVRAVLGAKGYILLD
jgi:hypothetical protein